MKVAHMAPAAQSTASDHDLGEASGAFWAKTRAALGAARPLPCQTAPAVFYQYLIKPLGKSCRARAL